MSKRWRLCRANLTASERSTSTRASAPNIRALAANAATTFGEASTSTTFAAPREAASKPRAPLPAKRSRHRVPLRSWPSQLNKVSRTRLGVGRTPGRSGKRRTRRRQSPPMMRSAFRRLFSPHDHRHHLPWPQHAGKSCPDALHGNPLDILLIPVEVIQRQIVKADQRDILQNLAIAVET